MAKKKKVIKTKDKDELCFFFDLEYFKETGLSWQIFEEVFDYGRRTKDPDKLIFPLRTSAEVFVQLSPFREIKNKVEIVVNSMGEFSHKISFSFKIPKSRVSIPKRE